MKKKYNEINLENISKKIKLLSSNKDEYCKYLVNIFSKYLKYMSEDINENLNYMKLQYEITNSLDHAINTSTILTSKLIDNINMIEKKHSKEKICLIYFGNKNSNDDILKEAIDRVNNIKNLSLILVGRYSKDISKLMKNNVKVSVVSMLKYNFKKTLSKHVAENTFIIIDINSIKNIKNWYSIMKDDFERMFIRLTYYTDKQILNNPVNISKDCIINKAMKKNNNNIESTLSVEQLIKKLIYIKKICVQNNICFGIESKGNIIVSSITNIDDLETVNKLKVFEISDLIDVFLKNDIEDIYSSVYDNICDYMENDIKMFNYCDFCDDQCVAKRDVHNVIDYPKSDYDGCCYNYTTFEKCKYLDGKNCKIKCISCRLFTCKYLKDRGFDYDLMKNPKIKCFINIFQRPIFVWSFYTKKEDILAKIFEVRN